MRHLPHLHLQKLHQLRHIPINRLGGAPSQQSPPQLSPLRLGIHVHIRKYAPTRTYIQTTSTRLTGSRQAQKHTAHLIGSARGRVSRIPPDTHRLGHAQLPATSSATQIMHTPITKSHTACVDEYPTASSGQVTAATGSRTDHSDLPIALSGDLPRVDDRRHGDRVFPGICEGVAHIIDATSAADRTESVTSERNISTSPLPWLLGGTTPP